MVQLHPGSLLRLVCRCFRRHTSSVRRKAGFKSRTDLQPSEAHGRLPCAGRRELKRQQKWAARPTGRRLACNQEIGVQLPGRSTEQERARGPKGRHQAGSLKIRVRFPVGPLKWKVAGYGWPGRSAKAVLACRDEGSNPLPSARERWGKAPRW